ncbi:MAG TPA: c-type cytochrome [Terriglobales bacterium]|nr:c-type cytochrome [Terriglobales bacterium]
MKDVSIGFVSKAALAALAIGTVVGLAVREGRAQYGQEHLPVPSAAKKAPEVYKNIQVLKDVPSDQVLPAMQFITASLGVQCDFCHVPGAFEKDDLKPKQTARLMMRMMFAINKDNFKTREVTCYTCHRGSKDPASTPAIPEHEPTVQPVADVHVGAPDASSLLTTDQILDNYVRALGGPDALQKISARVEKGTITAFGGRQFPIDVFAKAPDKRMSVMHLPGGDSVTVFDGQRGWLAAPDREPREMTASDIDAARFDADLHFPLHPKEYFSEMRLQPQEKISDRETSVILGIRQGQPPMKLYFDSTSALLVRVLRYAETPLGRNPTQIDYADYRETGGVKVPYRWTIARPSGRFTIQLEQVQQNVPIEDSKFAKPSPAR